MFASGVEGLVGFRLVHLFSLTASVRHSFPFSFLIFSRYASYLISTLFLCILSLRMT